MALNTNTRVATKTRDRMNLDADICVVGGGAAGIMAALTAARLGKRTVLLDAMDCIPTALNRTASRSARSTTCWPISVVPVHFIPGARSIPSCCNTMRPFVGAGRSALCRPQVWISYLVRCFGLQVWRAEES